MVLVQKSGVSRVALVAALSLSIFAAGCDSGTRTGVLTGGGAAAGAIIGSRHGVGGAIAGAIIGGAAGLIVSAVLDEIERQQVQQAQMTAARSGRAVSSSFRNNSGQRVRQTTKAVRTYDCGGVKCRELSTSVSRDGGAPTTTTATAREVKSGGKTEWVVE
jgi:surface antigen